MTGTIRKIGLVATDDAGRLLVVRKHGGETWILVGGKPEGDESDLTCLQRETSEELGVQIAGAVDYMGVFSSPAADLPGRLVELRAWRGEIHGDPRPLAEIAELRWVDPLAPDVPLAPSIVEHILPLLAATADDEESRQAAHGSHASAA